VVLIIDWNISNINLGSHLVLKSYMNGWMHSRKIPKASLAWLCIMYSQLFQLHSSLLAILPLRYKITMNSGAQTWANRNLYSSQDKRNILSSISILLVTQHQCQSAGDRLVRMLGTLNFLNPLTAPSSICFTN
jgi:hypothetical protein